MKKMTAVDQWVVYKAFLEEVKKIGLEKKLPDIYVSAFTNYTIDNELHRVDEHLRQKLCKHFNTRKEYTHDSHYEYENISCVDCGQQLDSIKV